MIVVEGTPIVADLVDVRLNVEQHPKYSHHLNCPLRNLNHLMKRKITSKVTATTTMMILSQGASFSIEVILHYKELLQNK